MYLEHFGLSEAPFRITPHTDFFFSGGNRGATLEALAYAITHDEGIVKVSGEVGSGKTMLCRVLMERLPAKVVTIYLANPSLSRDDILFALADELNIPVAENARATVLLRALQEKLIELYAGGHQVVVLIDEAHAMPAETLEEIRLLSNLESNRHKLLQLVLFGQTELNEILARPAMRQLKDRITHNFTLEPLVRADIASYLTFRMRAAGYRGPDPFGLAAVRLIEKASQGLTRRINILADKSLLAAFAEGGYQILPRHVKAAIRDSEFSSAPTRNVVVLASAAAATLLVAAAAGWWWINDLTGTEAVPPPPVRQDGIPPGRPGTTGSGSAVTPVVATPPQASMVPSPPVAPAAVADTSPASTPPAPERDDMREVSTLPPGLGERTRTKVTETRAWLAGAKDDAWFLQILVADGGRAPQVERLIAQLEAIPRSEELRAYVASLDGRQRIGLIFGEYPSREAAQAAISALPPQLRAHKPFPRQVGKLR